MQSTECVRVFVVHHGRKPFANTETTNTNTDNNNEGVTSRQMVMTAFRFVVVLRYLLTNRLRETRKER